MTTATRPRVRLPSQRDLNPNLHLLIALAETYIDAFGPAAAAMACAKMSADLRSAAEHPTIAGVIVGPLVVGPDCLIALADWMQEAAIAAWACQQ